MFKNLRRNSKQLFEPIGRRKSVQPDLPTTTQAEGDPKLSRTTTAGTTASTAVASPSATDSKLTFFDLPAEIRNVIYEDVARSTRIFIPTPSKKTAKLGPPPIPSLLLVSRQTRREYLPLLLSIAPISTVVKDFDFSHLTRITSSLYSTELKALRLNPTFIIRLRIERCSRETIASLRRWLTLRATALDRIAFTYGVAWSKQTQIIPTSTQVHRINVYINRRALLSQNLEAMANLRGKVEEAVRFELLPLQDVLREELNHISTTDVGGTALGSIAWHDDAFLMMYGMPQSRRV